MPKKAFPDVINNLKIFSGISVTERDKLLADGSLVYFKRGEYLFRQGEPIKYFYIVCSGYMQLFTETPDGKEMTVDIATPGKALAKSELLRPSTTQHCLSAKAVIDSVALRFPSSWLKKIASHPVMSMNILSVISQYAHFLEIESEHKSNMSAAQQLGCFLQRLCMMHNLDPAGFELPYSKILIASRLGMEPETFSRALVKLRENGIEIKDTWVRFTDREQVEKYVCERCSISRDCDTHKMLAEQEAARKRN